MMNDNHFQQEILNPMISNPMFYVLVKNKTMDSTTLLLRLAKHQKSTKKTSLN